jgi:ABC-type lipoprotein release transport system permease subunit
MCSRRRSGRRSAQSSRSLLLFGLTTLDATTYAGVAVAFGIVATVAAYTPARRAARVDQMVALRRE